MAEFTIHDLADSLDYGRKWLDNGNGRAVTNSFGDVIAHNAANLAKNNGAAADQFDKVNAPNYYFKGGVWCKDMIKAITANLTGYEAVCVGNITKYIWRFKGKNGVEDLKKARKYLDDLIEHLEKM